MRRDQSTGTRRAVAPTVIGTDDVAVLDPAGRQQPPMNAVVLPGHHGIVGAPDHQLCIPHAHASGVSSSRSRAAATMYQSFHNTESSIIHGIPWLRKEEGIMARRGRVKDKLPYANSWNA